MNIILTINVIVAVVFACCYAYQLFFLAVPFTRKQEAHKPEVLHRFAILICARNESAVIADLLQSIQHQSYDQSLITTFVMADNCTDNTARSPSGVPAAISLLFPIWKITSWNNFSCFPCWILS